MANENIVHFTDTNFEAEVLQSDKPVLVDFWAEWCMPCRLLNPTIDQVATEYAGRVKVGKMDTDTNRNVPAKYGINTIPTVILFHAGQPVKKFFGIKNKSEFAAELDALTKKG